MKHIENETGEYYVDDNGLIQGEYKCYYDNGQLWIHCNYKDGLKHGEYKCYYKNCQLWIHCNYKDDKKHGEYKEYYHNGKLNIHCYYKDGERHGEYREYKSYNADDGQLKEFQYFQNGEDVTQKYLNVQKWKEMQK